MMLNRRNMIFGLGTVSLGLALPARAAQQIIGGHAFGSTWRVVTGDTADLALIRSTVQTIVDRVDLEMSPYRNKSTLSHFNTSRTTTPQQMPPSFCHVTKEALDIAELTNGAFDPTVGPIVGRYGFGPIKGAFAQVGGISIDGDTIAKSAPHLTLDLCGIAKGYALDQIVAALSSIGVDNALVEIGGEVKTIGQHPDGRAWRVAITDPLSTNFGVQCIIDLKHYALATSGHAANGIFGQISTSHIIDPVLEQPASTALASVSVLATSAMKADALATALCAAGPTEGIALARQLNIAALFVTDASTTPAEIMTGAFSEHVIS